MSFQCLEPPLVTDKVNFLLGGLALKPNPLATYGLGHFVGTDERYTVVKTLVSISLPVPEIWRSKVLPLAPPSGKTGRQKFPKFCMPLEPPTL